MRASETSFAIAHRLVQRWVTPGAVALVLVISATSAVSNRVSTTAANVALQMQCAHGYSGCIGVLSIGCHPASSETAGLPVRSPLRIAVMGRQKSCGYLH